MATPAVTIRRTLVKSREDRFLRVGGGGGGIGILSSVYGDEYLGHVGSYICLPYLNAKATSPPTNIQIAMIIKSIPNPPNGRVQRPKINSIKLPMSKMIAIARMPAFDCCGCGGGWI